MQKIDDRYREPRLLQEMMQFAALRHPHRTALVIEGKSYSYEALLDAALRLASAMRERGLQRGDRVAIYMDNTWFCVVSIYATLFAGGVFLVINPQTKSGKLRFILEDSGSRILLSDLHLLPFFENLLDDLPAEMPVWLSGERNDGVFGEKPRIESLLQVMEVHEPREWPQEVIPLDLAALIYTSGSTGTPKGVMQTHQSMVFSTGSLIEYLRLDEDDRILLALPMAFDYGLYQLFMSTALGATLVIERSFTYMGRVIQRMRNEAVTVLPGVPTVFSMLLSSHRRKPLRFEQVRTVTNTAAALPPEYITELMEIFPNARIFKMYGLTECKRVSYLEPEKLLLKPGSVGGAIPGTEVFLRGPRGEPVAPGEAGILHVRGPHIMKGYWKQPERTRRMLIEGEQAGEFVLCTHDWFRMDEEGDLYFIGRSDDIIKTRGEKVSPLEIENQLHACPGIREVAIFGVPDPVLGEAVCLYASIEEGSSLTRAEIKRYCVENLENFMVPKYLELLDDLPKSANGKIDKKQLREMHND